jgi:hypothetical protein
MTRVAPTARRSDAKTRCGGSVSIIATLKLVSEGPKHPQARVEASDGSETRRLSEELITFTFRDGLWYRINERFRIDDYYPVLLDEYEEQELSVEKLHVVSDEIRSLAQSCARDDEVSRELEELATVLDRAQERGVNVVIWL